MFCLQFSGRRANTYNIDITCTNKLLPLHVYETYCNHDVLCVHVFFTDCPSNCHSCVSDGISKRCLTNGCQDGYLLNNADGHCYGNVKEQSEV